jgi:hypothetical protein
VAKPAVQGGKAANKGQKASAKRKAECAARPSRKRKIPKAKGKCESHTKMLAKETRHYDLAE